MSAKPSQRRKARRYAVQALYHWQLTQAEPQDVIDYMLPDINTNKTDMDYFEELVKGIQQHKETIDSALTPALDRDLESVDPIERAILRMAVYELQHHPEIPYRVIVNEAIEQAKTFGAEDGHKYINGVLHKTSAELRAVEFEHHRKSQNTGESTS